MVSKICDLEDQVNKLQDYVDFLSLEETKVESSLSWERDTNNKAIVVLQRRIEDFEMDNKILGEKLRLEEI